MKHYEADDRWGEFEGSVFGSGDYPVVSIDNSMLCPYHADVMMGTDSHF